MNLGADSFDQEMLQFLQALGKAKITHQERLDVIQKIANII